MIVQAMFFVRMCTNGHLDGPLVATCPDLPGFEVRAWAYEKLYAKAMTEGCFFTAALALRLDRVPTFTLEHDLPAGNVTQRVMVLSLYAPDHVLGI